MIKVARLVEGTLTYLNALLILDLARASFSNRIHIAVVIVAIVTLVIILMYNSHSHARESEHTRAPLPVMYHAEKSARN
jgi:uncharacterized PurR-regulated membrane protein YhhQ (DUF165 family)